MVTKVTLNLPSDLVEQVKKSAKEQHLSVTDLFRRGLQTDLYLTREETNGGKVIIQKNNGTMVELFRPH